MGPTKVIISDVRPVRIHGHGDGNASAEPSPPPQTELVDPRTDPSYAKQKKRSKRAATVAAPERPEVDPEQVIQKVERFREERIAGNADASTSISVISPTPQMDGASDSPPPNPELAAEEASVSPPRP